MSPSWRNRVHFSISPHQVAMVRLSGLMKPRVVEGRCVAVEQSGTTQAWAAPLSALRGLVAGAKAGKAQTTIILSNHFVRYLTLPWSEDVMGTTEVQEYARARFSQVHGDAARDWVVRTSRTQAGGSWLAAATDAPLVDGLRRELAGARLVSCQPALMTLYNQARSRIGDEAWLVSIERARVLIANIHKGQWHSVRTRRPDAGPLRLRDLIEQECLLVPQARGDRKIFAAAADDTTIDAGGLKVEALVPRASGTPARALDARFALVLAGVH